MEYLDLDCSEDGEQLSSDDASELSDVSTNLSGFIASDSDESFYGPAPQPGAGASTPMPQRSHGMSQSSASISSKRRRTEESSSQGTTGDVESSRGRSYCFTWNNYTPSGEEALRRDSEGQSVRYCCFGREKAPTTGTRHLQGVIYFRNPRKLHGVRRFFERIGGHGVHIEPMRGTLEQAIAYSKKDGDFWECGDPPKDAGSRVAAGKRERKRWAAIREACENQQYALLPDDYVCRYRGNPQRILMLKHACASPPDRDRLVNYWLWGESGTGKSRSARAWAKHHGYSIFVKDPAKWWDGYVGQDVVLFEEFGPEEAKTLGQYLKRWTDHYAFPGECKGAPSRLMRPAIVIVTSNYQIGELFPLSRDSEPLLRRFTVFEFKKDEENLFFNV